MINKLRALFTIIQMAITISLVIIFMYIFKNNKKKVRHIWAALQMKLLGITLDIEGQIDQESQMLIINHQSVLDIVLFEYLDKRDLAWISKKEIGDIPWFGQILKLPNMIAVQRESKKSLIKLLKDVKDRLDNNRPIAIFPEGTRTDGKSLRKFKSGAKVIANKYKMKVQPVVVIGTRHILDSQNLKQNSGTIKVRYLPLVDVTQDEDWFSKVEDDMKQVLERELV